MSERITTKEELLKAGVVQEMVDVVEKTNQRLEKIEEDLEKFCTNKTSEKLNFDIISSYESWRNATASERCAWISAFLYATEKDADK